MRRQTLIDRRPAQIRSGYPGRVMEAATPEAAQGPAYNERDGGPHLYWQCKKQLRAAALVGALNWPVTRSGEIRPSKSAGEQ